MVGYMRACLFLFKRALKRQLLFLASVYFSMLCFLSPAALFADRIFLKDGKVLRGKIVKIEASRYKLKRGDGSTQNVPKSKVIKVIFTHDKFEKGYEKFFVRFSLDLAHAEYRESLELSADNSASIEARHTGILGLSLSPGYMLLDYILALHGGLDYRGVVAAGSRDIRYSYLSLRAGFSYYFDFSLGAYNFSNLYVSPYLGLPLSGSVQSDFKGIGEKGASFSFGEGELSYGISFVKEWYGGFYSKSVVYGAGINFGRDAFSLDRQGVLIEDASVELYYLGFTFSMSYD